MDNSLRRPPFSSEAANAHPASLGPGESNDISLVSLWRLLLRRRLIVFLVLALALAAGLLLASRPRKYIASGSLQIRSGSADKYKVEASELAGAGSDSDDRIESEVAILQSKTLYTKVAAQLYLASNPAIMGKKARPGASLDDPYVQAQVVGAMARMIHVERLPKTQIITVECTSTVPLLGAQIVNTLVNQYIERIFETRFSSTQRAAKFLTQQLDDLKNQVLQDQQKLVDLQGRLGVIGFDDSHNLVTAQLEELARANQQANIQRITAEARYRILEDEQPNLIDGGPPLLAGNNPNIVGSLLQTLRSSQAQIANEYASVSEQFGPNYPEAKRLKAQLAEATRQVNTEQTRVLEQARLAYQAAANNQRMTSDALTQSRNQAFQQRNDMVNYQILLHDYQSSRTLYEGLMQRLREAGVVSGLESGEIELIDLATLPVAPTGYGPIALILISLFLGLILAVILVTLVEAMDTSVHNVDDLERYLNLPVLAVLPSFTIAARTSPTKTEPLIELLRSPQSHFSEGIRLLRSSLLLARAGHRPRTMLFTSSMPQEGKSTVCSNEACALAQNGSRVLLIDADLRRPSQHTRFGIPNITGLSNILTGTTTLNEAVQPVSPLTTLFLLPSGPIPPSPGELLASIPMRELLDQACTLYDFILIDTPPSLAISDAAILAESLDAVVLVVRDGVANKKMVLRMRNTLTRLGAVIPGFVFNGVNRNSMEYHEYKGQYGYAKYRYEEEAR